jgi:ABC-type polysaccharide/polyol phosphate export permease
LPPSAEAGLNAFLRNGLFDVAHGLRRHDLWTTLGWQDIRQRYRRSVLGPFWVTLSMAVMTGSMGILYSQLFAQPLSEYLPFLTIGLVMWGFLSALITDGCQAFIAAESMIKQVRMPVTVHVWREIWRNLIILAHNALVVVVVLALFGRMPHWQSLLLPVAIALLIVNGWWMGAVLGALSARFRDIPQLVGSLLQVLFFLTPVIWSTDLLHGRTWLVDANPAYHMIQIVRAPLLGEPAAALSWLFVAAFTGAGSVAALLLLSRFRARIAYWI